MKDIKDILLHDETLFKNEDVFDPEYMPPTILHRDSEIREIVLALKPALRKSKPLNVLIHGPVGSGKTTVIRYVFDQIRETTGDAYCVYINCEDSSTPYAIFSKIYESIFHLLAPSTGKPLEELKERIFKKLIKEDRSLIVALDELDRLFSNKMVSQILIDLLKAHLTYGFDKVGVVGIMIDSKLMAFLDEKSRSVFNPVSVEFRRYSKEEVEDILEERIRLGLYPGVLKKDAFQKIVQLTLAEGSDIRFALQLIKRSVLLAEYDSMKEVTIDHVEKAYKKFFGKEKFSSLLSEEERMVLETIKKSSEKTSGKIYEKVRKEFGMSMKKYWQIVKKLEEKGFIKSKYREGIRGRSREFIVTE